MRDKPSYTAGNIALTFYLHSKDPVMSKYIDPEMAKAYKVVSHALCRNHKNLLSPLGIQQMVSSFMPAKLYTAIVDQFNYGFSQHLIMRKAAFGAEREKSIENDGIKQLVLIGSGYDYSGIIAAKKHYGDGLKVFLLDHPKTLENSLHILGSKAFKKECGSMLTNGQVPDNVEFIPVDLNDKDLDLGELLGKRGFNPRKPSIIEAQGLLCYFEMEKVNKIVKAITDISAENSIFMFNMYRHLSDENNRGASITDRFLESIGEVYKSSMTHKESLLFAIDHGYVQEAMTPYVDLQRDIPRNKEGLRRLMNERPEDLYKFRFVGRDRTLIPENLMKDSDEVVPQFSLKYQGKVTECNPTNNIKQNKEQNVPSV